MAPDQTLQRALGGDRDALNALFEREWHAVYLLLYRHVQNREEAQDLTQEVFARALRSLDRYQITDTPFQGYLATIARNLIRDRWKQRRPIARTFAALLWDSLLVFGPPLGLFAVAVSLHELGQGRLRAVLGWIGIAAGALALFPWSVWVGTVAVMAWIVALSIVLLVSPAGRLDSFRQTVVPAPRGA